ncbi:MAG: sulfotransferase [Nitrospirota bacterium]|nr:MAG: sulfotransferase [Nitrospirota bacterium]
MKNRPLIILGMHRAGTSMLVNILERLGVFFGKWMDINSESTFFLRMNEWIFEQTNASWDNPYNFKFINDDLKQNMLKVLRSHVKGLRRIEYMGVGRLLKYGHITDIDRPWGWKDPRNTFTADLWKMIFPEALLLHVYRNPIDVASSLRQREQKIKEEYSRNWKKYIMERMLMGKIWYQGSIRTQDIMEGIRLWEEYTNKAFSLDSDFGERIVHIKFEDVLAEPEKNITRIMNYAGISAGPDLLRDAIADLRYENRYKFLNDEDLVAVFNKIRDKELVVRLGYDKACDER